MYCAPGHVFGGADGVGSPFHVLRSQTHFQRYRGRQVPFSCLTLPDTFSPMRRASGPVFMFCALELVFGGSEGVWYRFHVLRSRTHFRRYRGCRVLFSCFARPDSFSEEMRVSGSVFMFCAPGVLSRGTAGIESRFHILRARIHFQRYRGRRLPFHCFVLPDSFLEVPRASAPVFMFCAP
jgi:hypothetical protein